MDITYLVYAAIVLTWVFFLLGFIKAVQLSKGIFKIIIGLSFPATLIIVLLFRHSYVGELVGNTFYFQIGSYVIFYLIYLTWLGYKKFFKK